MKSSEARLTTTAVVHGSVRLRKGRLARLSLEITEVFVFPSSGAEAAASRGVRLHTAAPPSIARRKGKRKKAERPRNPHGRRVASGPPRAGSFTRCAPRPVAKKQ